MSAPLPRDPSALDAPIDIPIEIEEPVYARRRGQGTAPPVLQARTAPPFTITPATSVDGVRTRPLPSLVVAVPTRARLPAPTHSIDEAIADSWYETERFEEVPDVEEDAASTGERPRSSLARGPMLAWIGTAVSAACIACLAYLVLRRDVGPTTAPPVPPTTTTPTVTVEPFAPAHGPTDPRPPAPVTAVATTPVVTTPPPITTVPAITPPPPTAPAITQPAPPPTSKKPRPHVRGSRRPTFTTSQLDQPAPRRNAKSKGGEGILMVSTKPPCEIVIDGVATVLTTPQRALKLPAGKHTLTLFNLRLGTEVTLPIVIEARKTTKIIRDLMQARR